MHLDDDDDGDYFGHVNDDEQGDVNDGTARGLSTSENGTLSCDDYSSAQGDAAAAATSRYDATSSSSGAGISTNMAPLLPAIAVDMPALKVRVPSRHQGQAAPAASAIPSSSTSDSSGRQRSRQPGGRVSFEQGTTAALAADSTPFGYAGVQARHRRDIGSAAGLQQQQLGRQHSGRGVGRSGSSGSSGGVGPCHKVSGRPSRLLQRSHSGPPVSELRDVSSAGQVIRMAGERGCCRVGGGGGGGGGGGDWL